MLLSVCVDDEAAAVFADVDVFAALDKALESDGEIHETALTAAASCLDNGCAVLFDHAVESVEDSFIELASEKVDFSGQRSNISIFDRPFLSFEPSCPP